MKPNEIKCGSHQKVGWKCKTCGHQWKDSPFNRVLFGKGCPKCWEAKQNERYQNGSMPLWQRKLWEESNPQIVTCSTQFGKSTVN